MPKKPPGSGQSLDIKANRGKTGNHVNVFTLCQFSWYSRSYFLPCDAVHYQLLTDTCQQQKDIQTAQIYGRDWNMKRDFVMKHAMGTVESSNTKVERFPAIMLTPQTRTTMDHCFYTQNTVRCCLGGDHKALEFQCNKEDAT